MEIKLKLHGEPPITAEEAAVSSQPVRGRPRKIVVVVDDSPEAKVAIRFGAGRAADIDRGQLVLFHCIRDSGEFAHWVSVADRMREEAHDEAVELLQDVSDRVYAYCGIEPEAHIVEGEPHEELMKFIDEQEDVFFLILAANTEGEPGPLVDYFSGPLVGKLKCPLAIVPGSMTREQVDAMV